MNNLISILSTCILFQSITKDDLQKLLTNISINKSVFYKNETIALEGDNCSSIGIILSGKIEVKKLFSSGKSVTITTLSKGNIFGEVIIFSDKNTYPSTLSCTENSTVLFISKNDIFNLCNINKVFLNNFMSLLSNKILMLNKKLKNLSYDTIRAKIASYLLDLYKKQKSKSLIIPCSRKELADILGVPRPSLSRELINMKNDNLLEFNGRNVFINNIYLIEELL